ncbi:hypothetical protein F5Y16DRAFT_423689 [Xylariaceae sp. FL0255]|nr:hypothetical protein F5Y16DRAFT_423689 [Xylariaceae sp. FL0255]
MASGQTLPWSVKDRTRSYEENITASSSEGDLSNDLSGLSVESSDTKSSSTSSNSQSSKGSSEGKKSGKSEKEGEEQELRDPVTGRKLTQYGVSCLRCIEKGLRCTLRFVDPDKVPQCAACTRSKVHYCVRMRVLDAPLMIRFFGPPWQDPNFVVGVSDCSIPAGGTPVGLREGIFRLERDEMEEILYEHFMGRSEYVMGNYLNTGDMNLMALPPYNGADLPHEDRPHGWMTMDWRAVLPIWKNRALNAVESDKAREREEKKKDLELAREMMRHGPVTLSKSEEDEQARKELMLKITGSQNGAHVVDYLRTVRRYPARDQNLCDVMGEDHYLPRDQDLNDLLGETH